MKLIELEPQFMQVYSKREIGKFLKAGIDPFKFKTEPFVDEDFEEREHDQIYFKAVDSLTEADGIRFLDPQDFVKNGGAIGTPIVHIFFAGHAMQYKVGSDSAGNEVRWSVSGTGYDDLTLSPSIFVNPQGTPPGWHGFITNGEVTNA